LAGGASAQLNKAPASAKKEKDPQAKSRSDVEKPRLHWLMLALLIFAVVMAPLTQLISSFLGKPNAIKPRT
jgi:hypothetical protein